MEDTNNITSYNNIFSYSKLSDEYNYHFNCEHIQWIINLHLALYSVSLIMGPLAILSNCIFLITMSKHPSLRKTSLSVYLMTLSFVDICFSFGVVYDSMLFLLFHAKRMYLYLPVPNAFSYRPLQFLSDLCIVAISRDRYLAVSKPIQTATAARNGFKLRCVTVTVCVVSGGFIFGIMTFRALCWILPTEVFACPFGSVRDVANTMSEIEGGISHINATLLPVLIFPDIITLITSLIFTIKTYRILYNPLSVGQVNRTENLKVQRNLTKMAAINSSIFFICIILFDLYIVIYLFNFGYMLVPLFSLSVFNSGVNPIVYNIFGTRYRKAFLETFSFLFCFKNRDRRNDQELSQMPA